MDQRQLEVTLRHRLYESQTEPGLQALKEMCKLQVEKIKDKLLKADPATVPPLQGEAYTYAAILKWFSEPLLKTVQNTTVDKQ